MIDNKLFNSRYKEYMSSEFFHYEKSAIYLGISTDIFEYSDKDGRANLKTEFTFIGYCNGSKIHVRPTTLYYVIMVFDGYNEFWLHVSPDDFNDCIKPLLTYQK
jgi:hypothetical protein